jgi:hypothetical protein
MSCHAFELPYISPSMITTPFPYHTSDDHQLPYISFLQEGQTARDRYFRDATNKMEKDLGLWGRMRRKLWETKMYSEIEIAKGVEEVREKVCSGFF